MRKKKLFLIIVILVLTALACDISLPVAPAEPDENAVATAVVLTLTASGAGVAPPEGTLPADEPLAENPLRPVNPLRIAYVDDGDLFLWTDGGMAVEIYDHATYAVSVVRLSEDGLLVAFTLMDGHNFIGLWAVSSDGASPHSLVDEAAVDAMGTNPLALGTNPSSWDFVPGSHTLAFNTHQFYEGPGLDIQDDLRLVDADTAVLSTLLAPGDAGQFYYSPDGSQIALVTPTTISLINADGSNRRDSVLTYTSVITYGEYQWYAIPRWALDGSYLRVAIPSADILDPAATVAVWHIPTDGSAASSLGFTASSGTHYNQTSTISPDMNKLAFLRQVGALTDNIREIRVVDLASFADSSYHSGRVTFESWAPDSVKFIYKEGQHLFVGQDGAGPFALPDTGAGIDPKWVDATSVLYLSGGSGSWELRLQTVGGSVMVIAVPTGAFPSFDFSH